MEMMNQNDDLLSRLLEDLDRLSLFDLRQVQRFVGHLLEDPERNLAVKKLLRPGMEISWFSSEENQLLQAIVIEIKKTRVIVQNIADNKRWDIYLYNIDIDNNGSVFSHHKKTGSLDRSSLRIGDHVGYTSRKGEDVFGVIRKLNPKNAVVMLNNGQLWNVHYSLLL
jgi:hypothetical protein